MFETFSQPLSTIFCSALSAFLAVSLFRNGKKAETAREMLEKVYQPAFKIAEPFLYNAEIKREQCNALVSEIKDIAISGGFLTDPELLDRISYYEHHAQGELKDYPNFKYSFFIDGCSYLRYWFEICQSIDKTYDVLSKKAFLPIRSQAFRLDRNQCINSWSWALRLIRLNWLSLLILALFTLFVISGFVQP